MRERGRGSLAALQDVSGKLGGRLNLSAAQAVALASIGVVGLALRLLWLLRIPNAPFTDFLSDQQFARQFASGVFPQGVTFQGAGYPLALGLAFRLAGSSDPLVGKVENLLFSLATLALCAYIFARLTARRWVAIAATALVALLPAYIAYTSVLGTEIVFTFCLAATLALQLARWNWRLRYPLMGLLIGYGAITKPYFLVYPAVAALLLWLTERDLRQAARLLAISVLGALVVVAPITWENYVQLHRFILNTYNGSFVLFVNSNSDNTTGAWLPFSSIHVSAAFRQQLLQMGVRYPDVPTNQGYAPLDPLFMAQARLWIFTHPLQFAHLGTLRLRDTFFNGAWDVRSYASDGLTNQQVANSPLLRVFFRLATLALATLSVAGFVTVGLGVAQVVWAVSSRARRGRAMSPALAYPATLGAYYLVVLFATEGQPRYAFPALLPFAFALVYLLSLLVSGVHRWVVARAAQPAPAVASASRSVPRSALDIETVKRPRVQVAPRSEARG
jgi:hypothetical protein